MNYDFDAKKVLRRDHPPLPEHGPGRSSYDSVGTWEWIVTPKGDPFLMEVNTRIQVENGVSAVISRIGVQGQDGVNLVREQIRLGLGEDMGYTQEEVSFDGVAIEYRIVAEDTAEPLRALGGTHRGDILASPSPGSRCSRKCPLRTGRIRSPRNMTPTWPWPSSGARDLEAGQGARLRPSWTPSCSWGRDRFPGRRSFKSNLSFLRDKTKNILEFKPARPSSMTDSRKKNDSKP